MTRRLAPPQRTLLRWLYLGRLSLATAVFLAAVLQWWAADLTQLLIATLALVASLLVTGLSLWHSHVRQRPGGPTFLYAQAVFDIALVTAVVHVSGPYSYFSSLYILAIAFNAVLMPPANGLLIALLAGLLYAADVVWGYPIDLSAAVWLQLLVFWLVAAVTSYLAGRLRSVGVAHDSLAAELRRLSLQADDILRNIGTGVVTVAADGCLLYANPAALSLLGIRAAEWADRSVLEHLDGTVPALAEAIRRAAREGSPIVRTEAEARLDGGSFPLGVTSSALRVDESQPPSVTALFEDISDRKLLEGLRLRSQRLEAVAEVAASLAHEIRNPLASIRSAVGQLARRAGGGSDERVLSGLIVGEADRLSRLLGDFLDFSRVDVSRAGPVDLVGVAEQGIRLAREHPDCAAGAVVELVAEERPVMVEGDEDLLHRVVFNLVINALQATSGGGRVRVSVRAARADDLPPGVRVGEPRLLKVEDSGPGIPRELQPRIFEPFVTGRAGAGGSGLGLAIVQRAVQAHRGVILCDSDPGGGAAFSVLLPARLSAGMPQ